MNMSTRWTGAAALILGLVTMSASFWSDTTTAGTGFTLGFGAIASLYALWSLIARDPTKDHWSLTVVGLVLFIAPWVGQFAGDGAAWTSWIAGALIMGLSAYAYTHDESANVTEITKEQNRSTYETRAREIRAH
nr:SPW repeat protein [Rhodococcus wratislaviensis]GLK40935.1 hypothetical protein GCM10017611_78100 [Rhodococcus wratislaviensis]